MKKPRPITDWVQKDRDTVVHEAGHCVGVVCNGGLIVRVVGSRHHALNENEAGSVEFLARGMTPWQLGFVSLAGRAAAEGLAVLVDADTQDEREAAELIGEAAMEPLRAAVSVWALRADVKWATMAVSRMLMDAPVWPGIPIEDCVRAALKRPAVSQAV